jgi:hypothetical protein
LQTFEQTLLLRRERLVELDSWDAIPGPHCGVCDYVQVCPLAKDASTPPVAVATPAQALHLAAALHVKEEWCRRARKQLRVYVERSDPVALPTCAYGFRLTASARQAIRPSTSFGKYKLAASAISENPED